MKIISWNLAGIKSGIKKGLFDFMQKANADFYCFQEVKSHEDIQYKDYFCYSCKAKKRGYSGITIFTKIKPLNIICGLNNSEFDNEGRVLTLEYQNYYLINAYFPHSGRNLERLDFKLRFNRVFETFCKKLEKNKPVIILGDFNVAHKEIDLANPKENKKNAGFTFEERNWFDSFIENYIDTFRIFNTAKGNYTWWAYRNNCRERNIGWRIDYFIVSKILKKNIESSLILKDVFGSDHCPIELQLKL